MATVSRSSAMRRDRPTPPGAGPQSDNARVLAECLNGANDFDVAGHAYAKAHDAYFEAVVTTQDWLFEMFFALGPDADAKRARALPKIAADPTRIPDHGASGPDLPYD